jgi:hypothetical protein
MRSAGTMAGRSVSIDLALLFVREGRTGELKELAEQMQLIFAAEDIHREAAAALVLFQEAARREALSIGTLEKIAAYLKAARLDPSLRYREA